MKLETFAEKFDGMFALTYALNENDDWMHDNEMWFEYSTLIIQYSYIIIYIIR